MKQPGFLMASELSEPFANTPLRPLTPPPPTTDICTGLTSCGAVSDQRAGPSLRCLHVLVTGQRHGRCSELMGKRMNE